MSDSRRGLGRRGEEIAAELLQAKGYRLHDRNWRTAAGEIDLVAQDRDCLVIVEVRTRRGRAFGTPEESITQRKQARLVALSEAYAEETGWHGPRRIDVVAVHMTSGGALLHVYHLQDAVSA